jgi:hypothetical protein
MTIPAVAELQDLLDIHVPGYGAKVIFADHDSIFVQEMRAIFNLPLPEDLVMMAGDGYRTWVVIPPTRSSAAGLLLTFFHEGDGTVALTPTLITSNAADYAPWRNAPFSTQAVIDAWDNLCFRRMVPTGSVQ